MLQVDIEKLKCSTVIRHEFIDAYRPVLKHV